MTGSNKGLLVLITHTKENGDEKDDDKKDDDDDDNNNNHSAYGVAQVSHRT
jgi:hypothetical protein